MSDSEKEETLETALSRILGVATDFFAALEKNDDWTFVIKLHALVEAALNHLIIARIGEPSLQKFVSRLETSNDYAGKLAVIRALELLPEKQRKFIKELSTIRNAFVHD